MILGIANDALANIVTGFLVAALGVVPLVLRPRVASSLALGIGLIGYGAGAALNNIAAVLKNADPASPGVSPLDGVAGFLLLGSAVAFAALALLFPRQVERHERRLLWLPAAFAGALTLAGVAGAIVYADALVTRSPGMVLAYAGLTALSAAFVGAAMLFAMRFRATPPEAERDLGLYALVGAALLVHPALRGVGLAAEGPYVLPRVLAAVGVLAVTVAWLHAASGRSRPALARNVALFGPAAALAGMLLHHAGWSGLAAVARVVGALLLTWAVLQHQLLGIDVKVRWGISRTTVAAVFIAVFFVASEAAQEFFGDTLGSSYVGILAAGALVFAIAPLSRVADRLAERAVPVAAPPRASRQGADKIYLDALRVALRDGRLTRDEELRLCRVAEALGIGAGRAHELLIEAERQPMVAERGSLADAEGQDESRPVARRD